MQNLRVSRVRLLTVLIMACWVTGVAAVPLTTFRYEAQAQRRCSDGAVVWLDFPAGSLLFERAEKVCAGQIR
jgi:hypothetical protein